MRDRFFIMLTAEQIRGARAVLRWSAAKLAEKSGVSMPTIQRMESANGIPKSLSTNLQAIRQTLERAGVVFIDQDGGGPGLRLKDPIEPRSR
jgi:predicted transcriptional regulator